MRRPKFDAIECRKSNYTIDTGLLVSQVAKNVWSFKSYSNLVQNSRIYGISHLVYYDDLVYKLRRVRGAANYFSSGAKIIQHHRLIKWTIAVLLGPSTALCSWTNKAIGTKWRDLFKPPQRRTGSSSSSPLILNRGPWRWASVQLDRAQPTLVDVTRYFYTMFFYLTCLCTEVLLLWSNIGPRILLEGLLKKLKVFLF